MASLGDTVLFTRTHQGTWGEYVAIVTQIWDADVVSLHVFVPDTPAVQIYHGVSYSENAEVPGTWHRLPAQAVEVIAETTDNVKTDTTKTRKSAS